MTTKEICWLVGWLVGWLVRLRSFRLFRLGQIVACRSLIIMPVFDKIYHQAVFRVVYTRLKHCQNMRFSAIFEKFIFCCFHHCLVAL